MMRVLTRRCRPRGDQGFSLIEAIVALTIAAVVLMSLAVAAIGTIRGSIAARQNQQAGDLLNKGIEDARTLSFSDLAMDPADVTTTDGGLLAPCTSGPGTCLSLGNGSSERLLMATGGRLNPHTSSVTLNHLTYTVRRYVTTPTDTEVGATYRRLTVYVQWNSLGQNRSRRISTYVTDTRRGLPLPSFKVTPVGPTTVTVNPGATVVFGLKVTNNGARDTWNLSASNNTLGWSWFKDDGDGVFDATKDVAPVVDTTSDGVMDTGPLEPTSSAIVWITRTVPSSPAGPYSSTVTFTAESFAQPGIPSVSAQGMSTTVNVQSGVVASPGTPSDTTAGADCPAQNPVPGPTGVTQTKFWLHNVPTGTALGNTVAQDPMPFGPNTSPTASTLYDYSTDDGQPTTGGRILRPGGGGVAETDRFKVADFRYRLTKAQTINGTVTVSLWVMPSNGVATQPVSLSFWLTTASKASGGSYVTTTRQSTSYTVGSWGCSTFNRVTVALPVNVTLANNDYVDVVVENSGSSDVRLAYDTALYNSSLVVPLS